MESADPAGTQEVVLRSAIASVSKEFKVARYYGHPKVAHAIKRDLPIPERSTRLYKRFSQPPEFAKWSHPIRVFREKPAKPDQEEQQRGQRRRAKRDQDEEGPSLDRDPTIDMRTWPLVLEDANKQNALVGRRSLAANKQDDGPGQGGLMGRRPMAANKQDEGPGQGAQYVLFVMQGSEFRVFPIREWYTFRNQPKDLKALGSLEEVEDFTNKAKQQQKKREAILDKAKDITDNRSLKKEGEDQDDADDAGRSDSENGTPHGPKMQSTKSRKSATEEYEDQGASTKEEKAEDFDFDEKYDTDEEGPEEDENANMEEDELRREKDERAAEISKGKAALEDESDEDIGEEELSMNGKEIKEILKKKRKEFESIGLWIKPDTDAPIDDDSDGDDDFDPDNLPSFGPTASSSGSLGASSSGVSAVSSSKDAVSAIRAAGPASTAPSTSHPHSKKRTLESSVPTATASASSSSKKQKPDVQNKNPSDTKQYSDVNEDNVRDAFKIFGRLTTKQIIDLFKPAFKKDKNQKDLLIQLLKKLVQKDGAELILKS